MLAIDATGGKTEPADWDPSGDAVAAAPAHHAVLYEDDSIRVLSVSLPAGAREPLHHHRWPSIFVIDRLARLRDFDADGNEIALPLPAKVELPLVLQLPPQPAHSVHNVDGVDFHGTRIEFKKGLPG